jgi:pyridoxal phosphate enzyme (YggS family)
MTQTQYKIYIDDIITRVEKARLKVNAHHIVKIVAISKYSQTNEIKKLYNIGQRAYGENKVQDLKQKSIELDDLPIEWHFVGNLQKNKINNLLDLNPSLFHGLDSLELAKEIQKKAKLKNTTLNALLQINSSYEDTKHGVLPQDAHTIYNKIIQECPNINLKGVMSIGAMSEEKDKIKKSFDITHDIYKTLPNATICSMGMSKDFELAIQCGSNMIRLGTIMFKPSHTTKT